MLNSSFNEAVVTRLKQILNIKTDKELSQELGMSRSWIGMGKKRGVLQINAIVEYCINSDKEISLDYIFGNQKAHRQ